MWLHVSRTYNLRHSTQSTARHRYSASSCTGRTLYLGCTARVKYGHGEGCLNARYVCRVCNMDYGLIYQKWTGITRSSKYLMQCIRSCFLSLLYVALNLIPICFFVARQRGEYGSSFLMDFQLGKQVLLALIPCMCMLVDVKSSHIHLNCASVRS